VRDGESERVRAVMVMSSQVALSLGMGLLLAQQVVSVAQVGEVAVRGRVFNYFMTPLAFNWTHSQEHVSYRASQLGQPGLPEWLKYKYSERHRSGLLYGVPPSQGVTEIQIVATDMITFDTSVIQLNILVDPEVMGSKNKVRLKIENLNIEDIFDSHRKQRLLDLFRNQMWLESATDLDLTFADSSLELGGRKPLQPSRKNGVVLDVASRANFSIQMLAMERETQPLRKQKSCNYKRTSMDRHFRQAGFAVDWCGFRLISSANTTTTSQPPPALDDIAETTQIFFPDRQSIRRDRKVVELFTSLLLPCVLFVIFSGFLGALLLTDCSTETQSKKNNIFVESLFSVLKECFCRQQLPEKPESINNNDIQIGGSMGMVAGKGSLADLSLGTGAVQRGARASSVQRQTDTLRSLGRRRDVTPRLGMITPPTSMEGDSLPSRSRTTSPCPSTTCGSPGIPSPRHTFNWEMFESLNRPNPPAYGSLPRKRQSTSEEVTLKSSSGRVGSVTRFSVSPSEPCYPGHADFLARETRNTASGETLPRESPMRSRETREKRKTFISGYAEENRRNQS